MNDFFGHYASANIVCTIIFGILLLHDLLSVDRQEKQIKYDNALIAFMLYFIVDCFWAAINTGRIPLTRFTVITNTLCIYVLMEMITYTWLEYVMAVEQIPHRNRPINKFAVLFPFIISTILMIGTYIIKPELLINDAQELQPLFNLFLVGASYINLAAVMFYAIRKTKTEENPIEKRKHLIIAFFPLMVIAGGVVQMAFFPTAPIFCYCSTILMLIFFIQSMDRQISLDPLTGLNNRGQLIRYVSQNDNVHKKDRLTYVVMIDINDFKEINDTYGHAEGDKALITVAEALKKIVNNHNMPVFLGRYGGDEFVIVVHPAEKKELDPFIEELRKEVTKECQEKGSEYQLSIAIGYDELKEEPDTFSKCLQRADKKLYQDKRAIKQQAA